ncbi:Uma2 family endonuclease [Clostridium sp. YIM B02505]|uniref:Uma2 family endonuclease n=1 Tax=Clostridium yunnanense TaxID=2800325 RepID=A0ABS1EUW9_9CLOT|nr:Uma2 family endonuclease [Clostridium yunnanense]MBK1813145.1 Uma2 family endonuclease [Clostridium yunnanense]
MDISYSQYYTEQDFEEIQSKYDGKAEYDNGFITLSSTTSIEHNRIKRKILSKLDAFFAGTKCEPFDEQIEVIFESENELRKYKPDIFVMCEDATRKGESFISPPKIVFEVVSKSTSSHDYITKLAVYQKYGVQEYDLVEQDGKIIQYSLEDGQYRITNVFKGNDEYISTVFIDLKISLQDIFQ